MEWNTQLFSGSFHKHFNLRLGVPKARFLSLGQDSVWLQGEKKKLENNGTEYLVQGFSNQT